MNTTQTTLASIARPATLALSAVALIALAGLSFGGPLNPPAGPVTATYKTLTEVEPRTALSTTNTPGDADSTFKITQPGSYYLTGNMVGQLNKRAIEITLSTPGCVTIDLNGFEISGVTSNIILPAIESTVYAPQTKIVVKNGGIRGWYGPSIDLTNSNGTLVENIAVANSFGHGIVSGTGLIRDCVVKNCTGDGITIAGGGIASGCTVVSCGGNGFHAYSGTLVHGCSASSNSLSGILMTQGGTVRDNQLFGNLNDGISVGSLCRVVGNNCTQSGNNGGNTDGAGVHATGDRNHIEGNSCTLGDRGFDIDGTSNMIIRNTCALNTTDWTIAVDNVYGPIIDRRAAAGGAVNGFTAASTLASTDSNANYSY